MTTRLTFPASMFSVVCQRCGSTVRKNADSCPTCGADRSAAFGHKRRADGASARPRGGMFEQTASAPLAQAGADMSTSTGAASASAANDGAEDGARTAWSSAWDPKRASERIAQKAAEHRARQIERVEQSARNAYADPRHDPDALPGSEDWTQRKTIAAGVCAAVLLAGVVAWWQHGDSAADATPSEEHSVSGAIASKNAVDAVADAVIADKRTQVQTHALNAGDPLSSVRAAIDQHDLSMAHVRLKALSAQQSRPEYEALKEELANRELKRDAALQLARACERTSAWACVQQNAGEALGLDGSNVESQAMLERVIEHAGWAGTNPAAAKKALAESAMPNAAKSQAVARSASPAAPSVAAIVPAPAPNPAQTNVATVTPGAPTASATPGLRTTPSQKSTAAERRAAQRAAAAARQAAADDARAQTDADSRAENAARAQAATNALTTATVNAPATANVTPAPTTQAVAPRTSQYIGQTSTQPSAPSNTPRAPQYIGDSQSESTASRGAQYIGQTPAQSPTPSGTRAPQYIGQPESRPQPVTTPATHAPQYIGQSSAPTSVPRSPASVQSAAQRVPTATVQTGTQAALAQPVTTQTNATSATASPKPDNDKTEALERAIKQYGWSGGNTMPKADQ